MLPALTEPRGFDVAFFKAASKPLRVGLIDADLLDNGSRCPNLALLKMAGWLTENGHQPRLIQNYGELDADLFNKGADDFDAIAVSRVFKFTAIPEKLQSLITANKVFYGGTGFFEINGPKLPEEVEHARPLYSLYDDFIKEQPGTKEEKAKRWKGYQQFSIGFTTRGCFRQCPFCVNRTYKRVVAHSPVAEFVDMSRPYIWLFDDNFMAAPRDLFYKTLEDLNATKKRFQFRQGLDIRLMTPEKAKALASAKYYGDYIFAFDHTDEPTVKATLRGLDIWRAHSNASTKMYLLCAYDSQDEHDIEQLFWRIQICMKYKVLPYVMRYESYKKSPWAQLYTCIARWCNQPALFKKKSFLQFMQMKQNMQIDIEEDFAMLHEEIAEKYFHLKYETQAHNI